MKYFNKLLLYCMAVYTTTLLFPSLCFSQDTPVVAQEFNTWTSFTMKKNLSKKISLSLSPEVRFSGTEVDQYLIESAVKYKITPLLSTKLTYRWGAEQKKSGYEFSNRFALDLKGEKKWNRFETALRLRYTTYFWEEDEEDAYLRYKIGTAYDIPQSKWTPYVSLEAFQNMSHSSLDKMRYKVGTDFKWKKGQTIGISYRLDYFLNQYKNKHIIGLNYKFKL